MSCIVSDIGVHVILEINLKKQVGLATVFTASNVAVRVPGALLLAVVAEQSIPAKLNDPKVHFVFLHHLTGSHLPVLKESSAAA